MSVKDKLEIVRIMPASRERVWAALTRPELFVQWFGTKVEVDLRVGGEFRFNFEKFGSMSATIEAVEPPHRFAFRGYAVQVGANLAVPPAQTHNTLIEFILDEVPEGTRLTLIQSGFAALPAEADLQGYYELIQRGWYMTLPELEKLLQKETSANS